MYWFFAHLSFLSPDRLLFRSLDLFLLLSLDLERLLSLLLSRLRDRLLFLRSLSRDRERRLEEDFLSDFRSAGDRLRDLLLFLYDLKKVENSRQFSSISRLWMTQTNVWNELLIIITLLSSSTWVELIDLENVCNIFRFRQGGEILLKFCLWWWWWYEPKSKTNILIIIHTLTDLRVNKPVFSGHFHKFQIMKSVKSWCPQFYLEAYRYYSN